MTPDLQLYKESLNGNKEAFGQLVEKYKSLVCSITYSATGDLSLSEDLAQETFLIAWKKLDTINEPEKFKSWLCGVARNLLRDFKKNKTPESLDETREAVDLSSGPRERAISKEEETLLWSTLEDLPESYREPLVLFYREQKQVKEVCELLELSEDNVKQKLSRGRKMLKDQMAAFVEETLFKSTPKKAFTVAVLGALPVLVGKKTAAAVVGATAAKGLGSGILGASLGSLLGILGGDIGSLV